MAKFSNSLSPEFEKVLKKGAKKGKLTLDETERLLKSEGVELKSLLKVADEVRKAEVGDLVTYVVNRNINFTNICKNSCKFCAFRRPENDPEAYKLSNEEVMKKTREASDRGATEICLQGGINPSLDFGDYMGYLKAIREVSTEIHIHAFSPAEINHASEKAGLKIEETIQKLKGAGLNSVPGTAAEILVDRVRKIICPNKIDTGQWAKIIKKCHELGVPTTATLMYGHVEAPREIAIHLHRLRKIQEDTGGFTELVPLAFRGKNTELGERGLGKKLKPEYHLKIHAVARLVLAGQIKNIQTSWVKLGSKLAQKTLNTGANDFSGTLMEENITRAAGGGMELLEPAEIRRLITETGKTPRERTTTYDLVPESSAKLKM